MRRFGLSVTLVILGLTMPCMIGVAHALTQIRFTLVPASAAVANCLPNATGDATVQLKEDILGVDTLHLNASGLPPDTGFSVFLTSADAFATPPFGGAEYIGDFTTNAAGFGSLKVDAIIAEAFVSTVVNGARTRTNVDHLVFWFADPAQAQAACGLSNVTPFDGDGVAGPAAMSSQGDTGLENIP
jgi:hypothetical protein